MTYKTLSRSLRRYSKKILTQVPNKHFVYKFNPAYLPQMMQLQLGLRKRFLQDFCTYRRVFRDVPSNAANCIFPRPTPVATATKFGTKFFITRFV